MKKVLIGCGIALVIPILLLIGGSVFMVSWFKNTVPEEEIKAARKEMVDRYGVKEEYQPPVDGALRVERIETFVAVRESLLASREEIAADLSDVLQRIHATEEEERGVWRKIIEGVQLARSGMGLVGSGTQYLRLRTERLLQAGMGDGEYAHLYALITYSWLKWDPMYSIGDDLFKSSNLDDKDVRNITEEYEALLVRHLRNQRRTLEDKSERTPSEERALERTVAALAQRGSGGFPFTNDMPQEWVDVLEPYRERFTATLPRTPAEFLLDAASLLDDEDTEGIQINFD